MRVWQPFHFIMLLTRMNLIGLWLSRLGPLNFKCLYCQSDKRPLIHYCSSSKDSSLFLPKFPIRCHISFLLIFYSVILYNQFFSKGFSLEIWLRPVSSFYVEIFTKLNKLSFKNMSVYLFGWICFLKRTMFLMIKLLFYLCQIDSIATPKTSAISCTNN